MTSVLVTLATIAAASIVLALTAALVGLQILSRYGSHASRMVMDPPVGILIVIAGFLGVALPVWGAVEPWSWLTTVGFASFSWSLLALAVASYLVLARLNSKWLTLSSVNRTFPLPSSATKELFLELGSMQSTLLEIAAGTDEAEPGRRVTLRAIALVGLARHRIDAKNTDLLKLVDTLAERTRSPNTAKGPPEETTVLLSLLALASDDSDVALGVVKAVHELVQDAIQQHHPIRRSLLDEVAGLVTDRLHALIYPATIDWLVAQEPIEQQTNRLDLTILDEQIMPTDVGTGRPELAIPNHVDWEVIQGWLETTQALDRNEWTVLSALVPLYEQEEKDQPEETVELIDVPTLVELDGIPLVRDNRGDAQCYDDDIPENDARSPEGWAETVHARHRHSDAYNLLEEGVALLVSACASPTPDDATWPGGWRGVEALEEDIQRLSSIGVSMYEAGLYPPTDRIERAIERIGARVVHGRRSELQAAELSSVMGWRVGEMALEQTTAHSVTKALRELATEAWRAGFARRSLLTLRRLVSIFTLVVESGNSKLSEELSEDLQVCVIRTAKSTDVYIAERERSRQLVLSLAPELMALGKAARSQSDNELWKQVFDTLDTIAWSPAGSEIEAATQTYSYFLAGMDSADTFDTGQPSNVTTWNRRPHGYPEQLAPQVREHLLHELEFQAHSGQPGIALVTLLALWRDAILQDDPHVFESLRNALDEHVLGEGRCDSKLPTLWIPSEDTSDVAPRMDGPRIHWRLVEVTSETHRWLTVKLATGDSTPAVLPPVNTSDSNLRSLIDTCGAENLVDERHYWGVESGGDCFVLVQEADGSRRLLRDSEERARTQFTWGYSGAGPHHLGEALVADMLGALAYCPSCFGAISAGGGLVECASCDGDGLRRNELWSLHRAVYNVTASLPKKPDPLLQETEGTPSRAQWGLSRRALLQMAVRLDDAFSADDRAQEDRASDD